MTFRPYAHQVEAAKKAICDRENLVVATGTGSGKTESFLIPVLHRLSTAQAAGALENRVYALVVYPMNALAEDQRRRLRGVLEGTNFTFGRLTGETPREGKKYKDGPELLTREAMTKQPPHILITNYSMLDRLLLLSAYKELFKFCPDFVVMDEAHGYSGAKGREIAILLRRVAASAGNEVSSLAPQYLALSATLGEGAAADVAVTDFAHSLFSNSGRGVSVIRPKRRTDFGNEEIVLYEGNLEEFSISERPGMSTRVHLFAKTPLGVFACLTRDCVSKSNNIHTDVESGAACSACSAKLVELAFCVACGASHIVEVDSWVSGNKYKQRYLLEYDALLDPSPNSETAPEVGLEWYSYKIDGPDRAVRVLKGREDACLACNHKDGAYGALRRLSAPVNDVAVALTTAVYPLLPEGGLLEKGTAENLVRTVARHYREFVSVKSVTPVSESLRKSLDDLSHQTLLKVLIEYTPPLISDETGSLTSAPILANRRVSELLEQDSSKQPEAAWRKLLVFSDNRQDAAYFASYVEDSYQVSSDRLAVFSILKGKRDGEWTQFETLITKLEAEYPAEEVNREGRARIAAVRELLSVDYKESLVGLGLAMTSIDSRLVDDVVSSILNKLEPLSLPLSCDDIRGLVEGIVSGLLRDRVLDAGLSADQVQEATGYRGSLQYIAPKSEVVSKIPPQAVAWLPNGFINGANSANRRTYFVEKFLQNFENASKKSNVQFILEVVLDVLIEKGIMCIDDRSGGIKLDPSKLSMRVPSAKDFTCTSCSCVASTQMPCPTWKCKGSLQPFSGLKDTYWTLLRSGKMHKELPTLRAKEHTAQLSSDAARVTQQDFVGDAGSESPVNLLSCSTTFEMGVDVGDVGIVVCRTVPPRPANYVQRAGRAGRRPGAVPVVVTIMRSSLPRDMRAWKNPREHLVQGVIPVPPVAAPTVELLTRHVYAEVIADILRDKEFQHLDLKLEQWYLPHEATSGETKNTSDTEATPAFDSLVRLLNNSVQNNTQEADPEAVVDGRLRSSGSIFSLLVERLLNEATRRPIVANASRRCGDTDRIAFDHIESTWADLEKRVNSLVTVGEETTTAPSEQVKDPLIEAWLSFIDEYAELFEEWKRKWEESGRSQKSVKGLETASRALTRLKSRDAIGHMANFGALPKFGFPAHQLSLQVVANSTIRGSKRESSSDLRLDRDGILALREYFPGNLLTAGKSRIRTLGVQRPPFGRAFELRMLVTCNSCGRVSSKLTQKQAPEFCSSCGSKEIKTSRDFLRPEWGFFGINEGAAMQGYQPKTTAATTSVYEDPATWYGKETALARWDAYGYEPTLIQKFVYTNEPIYCCFLCGFARSTKGSDALSEFQKEHRQTSKKISEFRSSYKVAPCRRSDKEYNDLQKWPPIRLFLREPAKAARLSWSGGKTISEASGSLVAELLRYALVRYLKTDPDDIDVQQVVRSRGTKKESEELETTGFLVCDAVPGGSGLIETVCKIRGGAAPALDAALEEVSELLRGEPEIVQSALNYIASRSGSTFPDLDSTRIEKVRHELALLRN